MWNVLTEVYWTAWSGQAKGDLISPRVIGFGLHVCSDEEGRTMEIAGTITNTERACAKSLLCLGNYVHYMVSNFYIILQGKCWWYLQVLLLESSRIYCFQRFKHLLCDIRSGPWKCVCSKEGHTELWTYTLSSARISQNSILGRPPISLNANPTHTPEPYNSVKQMFNLIWYAKLSLSHGISELCLQVWNLNISLPDLESFDLPSLHSQVLIT